MVPSVRPRDGFLALGLFCSLLGVQHLLFEGEGLGTVIESFIILSLSAVLFYTAYELPTRQVSEAGRWQSFRLAIGTAAAFAALAAAVWVTWWVEGGAVELSFLLSFATSLGALVGARAGLYAVEAEERLEEARELSKLLSINQRVLRHNIRNELSIALGYLETLEDVDAASADENVRVIRRHLEALLNTSERTQRIISVWKTDDVSEFELSSLLREQVAEVAGEEPTVSFTTDLPPECLVRAHPALPLAFEEAIENAIYHNGPDVTVDVRVESVDDGTVRVRIIDTGAGIPPSEREILSGAEETPLEHMDGLGLWLIYWTVSRSGGSVEILGNDSGGTTVDIELPLDGSLSRPTPWA